MTAREQILRDLLTSPSTAAAITDHTDIPADQVTLILRREVESGIVESRPLKMLTVWSLTSEGREIAKPLRPSPKYY